MNILHALNYIKNALRNGHIELCELEAYLFLEYILKTDKYKLITDQTKELTKNNVAKINNLIKRRLNGEPIAYITGKKEFYSLDFIITNDVLIPRPETEQLVEIAISCSPKNASVLDIGTGSGAIAVSLKKNRPDLLIHACDISNKALKIARKNALKVTGKNSIIFSKSDLFQAYKNHKFDIILSNPPYLSNRIKKIQKEIFFEPEIALFAMDNGKEILKRIISEARKFLNRSGTLILEIGYDQADFIKSISGKNHFSVSIINDYQNLPRIAVHKLEKT